MISLLDAEKFRLSEAAKRLDIHVSSLHRYAMKGVGGVKLPITRIGGKSYVLRQDLETFIARRSDRTAAEPPERELSARADDAGRKLDALGV